MARASSDKVQTMPPSRPRKAQRKTGPTTPLLWTPPLIVALSLLLTPVFGALLQMLNWRTLHEQDLARQALWWAVAGGVILLGGCLFSAFLPPHRKVVETFSASLFLLYALGWFLLEAGEQGRYVRQHFPKGHGRRPWKKPILWALAAYFGYAALGILLHWTAAQVL